MKEEITVILQQVKAGDQSAMERLFELAYNELHQLAKAHRRKWVGNETLNTTALLHEAYLKFVGQEKLDWQNRAHFFAAASRAMRHILVNYAVRQKADKRGGDDFQIPLEMMISATGNSLDEILILDQALSRLEAENARLCRIVECRFFGGMTIEETARALNVSPATITREWKSAITLLYANISEPGFEL